MDIGIWIYGYMDVWIYGYGYIHLNSTLPYLRAADNDGQRSQKVMGGACHVPGMGLKCHKSKFTFMSSHGVGSSASEFTNDSLLD